MESGSEVREPAPLNGTEGGMHVFRAAAAVGARSTPTRQTSGFDGLLHSEYWRVRSSPRIRSM